MDSIHRRRRQNFRHELRLRASYCIAILFCSTVLVLAFAISGTDYIELPTIASRTKKGVTSKFLKDHEIVDVVGMRIGGRRYLSGPGSSPPRCISKCGKCTPCKPVHVPVPPGTPITSEYYPEAWRCKCGNKLYMP
eukprot:Gb_05485 [translate_table: standard]